MNIKEAILKRHAVRNYTDKIIPNDVVSELNKEIVDCNKESGLNIQLITNDPEAFSGFMAHYGKFVNVKNYIALIGKKSSNLDEKIGYYGERIALKAQTLGLNTCWVAMSFSKSKIKSKCSINDGEKLVCVLSLGYGVTQGVEHKSKDLIECCTINGEMPDWFKKGMQLAMLAPTAMNQQKFMFTLDNDKVIAKSTGGFYSKVDLGIVKYHFEIGAERNI